MSARSKRIVLGSLSVIALLIVYTYAVLFTSFGLNAREEVFAKRIAEADGDIVVADIYPAPWDYVCFIPPYSRASEAISNYKKTPAADFKFTEGIDLTATEEVWGIAFVTASDDVQMLHMHPDFYWRGGTCADREQARLTVADDRKGLTLLSVQKE